MFKARGKLAGITIGLDDDLTILQQQRRMQRGLPSRTSGPEVSKRSGGAEKLFVKEGEHFVEHKVLNLQETRGQLGSSPVFC